MRPGWSVTKKRPGSSSPGSWTATRRAGRSPQGSGPEVTPDKATADDERPMASGARGGDLGREPLEGGPGMPPLQRLTTPVGWERLVEGSVAAEAADDVGTRQLRAGQGGVDVVPDEQEVTILAPVDQQQSQEDHVGSQGGHHPVADGADGTLEPADTVDPTPALAEQRLAQDQDHPAVGGPADHQAPDEFVPARDGRPPTSVDQAGIGPVGMAPPRIHNAPHPGQRVVARAHPGHVPLGEEPEGAVGEGHGEAPERALPGRQQLADAI